MKARLTSWFLRLLYSFNQTQLQDMMNLNYLRKYDNNVNYLVLKYYNFSVSRAWLQKLTLAQSTTINPIPQGMCRTHIDPTIFEAVWGPDYSRLQ